MSNTYDPRKNGDEAIVPVNIFTATPWWRAPFQWFAFWILRRPEWQSRRFSAIEDLETQLKRLNFLHLGRWVDVGRFPKEWQRYREPWHRRWMLFIANFNQTWQTYLDGFLDTGAVGINFIWGDSLEYPGWPREGSRQDTVEWSQTRTPESQHYYAAYGHLTTNEVRASIRVRRELRSFAENALTLHFPGAKDDSGRSDEDVTSAEALADFGRFLHRIQHCLGGLHPAPSHEAVRHPTATGVSSFVSLIPIKQQRESRLRTVIAGLDERPDSPFSRVPGTHFARLVVLDRAGAAVHPHRKLHLKHSWLLVAVTFDGQFHLTEPQRRRWQRRWPMRRLTPAQDAFKMAFRSYAAALGGAALEEVWQHCVDFSRRSDFSAWLERGLCPRLGFYNDYPDATLGDIMDASHVVHAVGDYAAKGSPDLKKFLDCVVAGNGEELRKFVDRLPQRRSRTIGRGRRLVNPL